MAKENNIKTRFLGNSDYTSVWNKMKNFTYSRDNETEDELWVTEHFPIYTLGNKVKNTRINKSSNIPLLRVDRGGDITYHAPGQIMIYVLINIRRMGMSVSNLIYILEDAVISLMKKFDVKASRKKDAPGVYVKGEKIASIGLRITRGSSYHGLSLNYDVDLKPFSDIDICGYQDLKATSLKSLKISVNKKIVADTLVELINEKITTFQT